MKKKYFVFLIITFLFYSCSTEEEPTKLESKDISKDILGKWVVITNEEDNLKKKNKATLAIEKDQSFRVFSLIFENDNRYKVVHNKGSETARYEVLDANNILLSGLGTLRDLTVLKDRSLTASLVLDDGIEISINGQFDSDYNEGDCVSFLECYADMDWMRRFHPIPNDFTQLHYNHLSIYKKNSSFWWKNLVVDREGSCLVTYENIDLYSDEISILAHSSTHLTFQRESEDEILIYSYYLQRNLVGSVEGLNLELRNQTTSNDTLFEFLLNEGQWEIPVPEELTACNLLNNRIYIPDDDFEQKLIDLGLDDILDDYISANGIEDVTELDLSLPLSTGMQKIEDLTGIEAFINLKRLLLDNNALTEINISGLSQLEILRLNNNQLNVLDCSGNHRLQSLSVNNNLLTQIDVSENYDLWSLDVSHNQLSEINLSNNLELTDLMLGNNELTAIDLSKNVNLWDLTINDNNLTSLDVSKSPELWYLGASGNRLAEIELQGAISLEYLSVINNELTHMNLSGLPALLEINAGNNELTSLVLENKPLLYLIYVEDNVLSQLDLSSLSPHSLDLRVTENDLSCIQVNTYHLEHNSSWRLDDGVILSLNCT